jgi:hypothetical protein
MALIANNFHRGRRPQRIGGLALVRHVVWVKHCQRDHIVVRESEIPYLDTQFSPQANIAQHLLP